MECPRLDRERLDLADMGDAEPLAADRFDILRPRIDIGHVLASLHHVRSGISADCSSADDRYLLFGHTFSPITGSRRGPPRVPRQILVRLTWPRHPIALGRTDFRWILRPSNQQLCQKSTLAASAA